MFWTSVAYSLLGLGGGIAIGLNIKFTWLR